MICSKKGFFANTSQYYRYYMDIHKKIKKSVKADLFPNARFARSLHHSSGAKGNAPFTPASAPARTHTPAPPPGHPHQFLKNQTLNHEAIIR